MIILFCPPQWFPTQRLWVLDQTHLKKPAADHQQRKLELLPDHHNPIKIRKQQSNHCHHVFPFKQAAFLITVSHIFWFITFKTETEYMNTERETWTHHREIVTPIQDWPWSIHMASREIRTEVAYIFWILHHKAKLKLEGL